jgi:hypothetical protein
MNKEELRIKYPDAYKGKGSLSKNLIKLTKKGSNELLPFEWVGKHLIENIFYTYLLTKYKSNCYIFSSSGKSGILLHIGELKKVSTLGSDNPLLKELNLGVDHLYSCIVNPHIKSNIIIIPLCLQWNDTAAHANVLIYRKDLKQLEHFEPEGVLDEKTDANIKALIKFFTSQLGNKLGYDVKYIPASEVCVNKNILGIQFIEELFSNVKDVTSGFCLAWSMFFTEMALKNPTIPSAELLNIIVDNISSKRDNVSFKTKANQFSRLIRGYVLMINDKIVKYCKTLFGEDVNIKKILTIDDAQERTDIFNKIKAMAAYEAAVTNPNVNLKKVKNNIFENISSPSSSYNINPKLSKVKKDKTLKNIKIKEEPGIKNCPDGKILNITNNRCIKPKLLKGKTVKILKEIKEEIAMNPCPDGKVLNVITNRCVKPKLLKVKKDKTLKNIKIKEEPGIKNCPDGKVLNTISNRCVKPKLSKVKKDKTLKNIKIKKEPGIKICSDGKVLNVITNRCVKQKH